MKSRVRQIILGTARSGQNYGDGEYPSAKRKALGRVVFVFAGALIRVELFLRVQKRSSKQSKTTFLGGFLFLFEILIFCDTIK